MESAHNLFCALIVLWLKHKDAAVAILCKHSLVDLAPRTVFGCNVAVTNKLVVVGTRLVECVVDVDSTKLCAQCLKEVDNIVALAVCVANIKCGVYVVKLIYKRQLILNSIDIAYYERDSKCKHRWSGLYT